MSLFDVLVDPGDLGQYVSGAYRRQVRGGGVLGSGCGGALLRGLVLESLDVLGLSGGLRLLGRVPELPKAMTRPSPWPSPPRTTSTP
ncbi:hypothetical protein ACIQZO_37675 [Streptomyces sp. NPDC097617]|uniref:hypothetical protein n=1 Tax=Streptomyces sp. NPDC097617 TaxID=3366091 RepID=UPI003803780E